MPEPSLAATGSPVWRLDRLANPHGPIERILDDVGRVDAWSASSEELTIRLRTRLGAQAGVPASWVVLANGIDELHAMIAGWRSSKGPAIVFPPGDPAFHRWLDRYYNQIEAVPRLRDFTIPAHELRLPHQATTLVMTPNDPTGTIVSVQDAVTLSRRSAMLVIDQRHAAYSPRTLIPLVREFENIVVVQTFETFAGLTAFPLAWAIAPPEVAAAIGEYGRPSGVAAMSILAGLSALDAEVEVRQSVRQVMVEKGRLFRQLRKLSMISPPYPSWSNFLLARFERGSSEYFVPRLAERGIHVQTVSGRGLANHVRISAVSREATYALKHALIDLALEV